MSNKQGKPGQSDNDVLAAIPKACMDETIAVEFMERMRWGNTPACPRCGDIDITMMKDNDGNRNKRYLWRCHGCKKQFTVRIGTILEDSRIPVKVWCHAFWRACSSKKGVSALQISRECSVSYKSALFLMHRVRFAMADLGPEKKFTGTVEADETYVGGKARNRQRRGFTRRGKMRIGGNTVIGNKAPVVGVVERDGNIRTKVVPRVNANTLREALTEAVDLSKARLYTDELSSYKSVGKDLKLGHECVLHGDREYVRGDVYTNTIESFFALLKRGIIGTFHAVSKKHLHRYASEFQFRWNSRKVSDGERIALAILGGEGKRLMYYQPVQTPSSNDLGKPE